MQPYYDRDGITIYHGDCREVLPRIAWQGADLMLTDPPYRHEHLDGGGFGGARELYSGGILSPLSQFEVTEYEHVLIDFAPMLIAFHSRDLVPDYGQLARTAGRKYDLHCWHKPNAIPFTANTWKSDLEYIALLWERKPGWKQLSQDRHSKCYVAPINRDGLHPTAKPIPLLAKYITILDAKFIIDPFMGSGTTLRAAKDLGRKAIGIELEERYCELAAGRLAQECLQFT